MRRRHPFIFSFLMSVATIAWTAPGFAQDSNQNTPSGAPADAQRKPVAATPVASTTYGDWVLKCQSGDQNAKLCELTQLVIEKEKRTPFAQIAVGRLKPDQPLLVTLVAPTNVSFGSAARIATDEKDPHPVDLGWSRCLPNACYASAQLKDDILKVWATKTQPGRVLFLNGAGQVTAIPISFKGLGQGTDALSKSK